MTALASGLDAILDAVWQLVATGLVHGTALVLIALLLSITVLRRSAPALMVALWTVVLIKFAVPVGPEMSVSMSALVDVLLGADGSAAVAAGAAGSASAGVADLAWTAGDWLWLVARTLLLAAYLLVVIRRLHGHARSHARHRRHALGLAPAGGSAVAIAVRAARRVGLRRLPDLRVTGVDESIAAPELIGLRRPIVVIPAHLVGSPDALEAALVHEFAHLRRRDPWLRVVQIAVGTAFFFWPAVAWVNRRIDDHREMACDQWAITWGRLSPGEYARTLVALARRACVTTAGREPGSAVLGMALARGKKQLEARVECLLARPARPRMGAASVAVLAAWALVSLGGTRSASADAVFAPECVIQPGVVESILTAFPEADTDGDGELSRDEVCAHQRRMKERVGDDRSAPRDHDDPGLLSEVDIELLDCAACGMCGDVEVVSADKRICSGEVAQP